MPAFPKPAFTYSYQVAAQIAALRDYEQTKPGRDIPSKAADRLLVASWNVDPDSTSRGGLSTP